MTEITADNESKNEVSVPMAQPRALARQRFLAQSIMLEEVGPSRFSSATLAVIAILVGGFIAWASITKVDEVAVTSGEVMPSGLVQTIQHHEGGIIEKIHVGPGDIVEAGTVLVTLRPNDVNADMEQLTARRVALELQAERMRAYAEDREPNYGDIDPRYASLVNDQNSIMDLQKQSRESQVLVLNRQIAQREGELAVLGGQEKSLREQIALLSEQLKMRETLLEKGLVSRVLYLETQRELSRNTGALNEVTGKARTAREAIAEAKGRIQELDSKLKADSIQQMGLVTKELAELHEAIARIQDRKDRLEVTSPVRGIVQSLEVNTIGGVIAAGGPIAKIVPLDETLVVETRVLPKDIGFIALGQSAKVKFSSYDFTKFGALNGKVSRISATTFTDDQGNSFYRARIDLDHNYVGDTPGQNLVLPGMTVVADIKTGRKTLVEYLVRPIYTALTQAFHER
ncbi:MAG: HlyD family type I secretion periplasmic adaptor subunit [Alphaproteobacteria bacterium]